jgi:NADPH:quinone reductase-like Zn-dependent oxidoreductase
VVAVSSSPERGARLLELGAEAVVPSVADADGPFDLLLESVGGTSLTDGLARLRLGGLALWFGQAGGEPATLDFFSVQSGDGPPAAIVPFSYWRTGASDATDLAALARLVASGHLHPEIGLLDSWTATPHALAALRDRRLRGNAVLRVAPTR